eukprot:3774301-Amphidinium_carterae.2
MFCYFCIQSRPTKCPWLMQEAEVGTRDVLCGCIMRPYQSIRAEDSKKRLVTKKQGQTPVPMMQEQAAAPNLANMTALTGLGCVKTPRLEQAFSAATVCAPIILFDGSHVCFRHVENLLPECQSDINECWSQAHACGNASYGCSGGTDIVTRNKCELQELHWNAS